MQEACSDKASQASDVGRRRPFERPGVTVSGGDRRSLVGRDDSIDPAGIDRSENTGQIVSQAWRLLVTSRMESAGRNSRHRRLYAGSIDELTQRGLTIDLSVSTDWDGIEKFRLLGNHPRRISRASCSSINGSPAIQRGTGANLRATVTRSILPLEVDGNSCTTLTIRGIIQGGSTSASASAIAISSRSEFVVTMA